MLIMSDERSLVGHEVVICASVIYRDHLAHLVLISKSYTTPDNTGT